MEELRSKPLRPVTLRLMIAEAVTGLSRHTTAAHAAAACREIHAWAATRLEIVEPDAEDFDAAIELMERFAEPKLSYQDCVAFAVMKRTRIRLAFTTDQRHFGALGQFEVVP